MPAGVEVFEIYGPFFFGAANQFKDTLGIVKKPPKVLVLRVRHVLSFDATAMRALDDLIHKTRSDGTALVLSGVRPQLASYLNQNGFKKKLAGVSICPDIDTVLAEARLLLVPT